MIQMLAEHVLPKVDGLTLIMAGTDDGIVTISVISDKKKVAVAPINIKGPAAEVEAELERAIQKIFIDKAAILSNVDEVAEEVKPEEKTTISKGTTGKNVKTTTSKSKTKTTIKAKETDEDTDDEEEEKEEVVLNAEQKKEAKAQEKNFERAEKTADIDVINFVEKEVIKAYEKVKMPEQTITEAKERFEGFRTKLGTAKSTTESAPAGEGLFANASTTPAKETAKKEEPVKEEKKADPPAAAPAATEDPEMIF